MSNMDNSLFSPFFRAKKFITVMRWGLAFPLKATDNKFVEFKFHCCQEILKYSIYLCIMINSLSYSGYACMARTNIWNPVLAVVKEVSTVGVSVSVFDIAIFCVLPLGNILFNTIYLYCFKKGNVGLSKLSRHLTDLNAEVYSIYKGPEFEFKANINISYTRFVMAFG